MRINSQHSYAERGADAYFTPIEAVLPLIEMEDIPNYILEPSAGNGAIVEPLVHAGHIVRAHDLHDYGAGYIQQDYLTSSPSEARGIITNPPYKLAEQFARKAISEAPYVAFLLRMNWLEGTKRKALFDTSPPSRVLVSSRRLPMMHRYGWDGPEAPSNTCYAWFVWDYREGVTSTTEIKWFDFKDFT